MYAAIVRLGYAIYPKDSRGNMLVPTESGTAHKVINATTLEECQKQIDDLLLVNYFKGGEVSCK